MIDVGLTRGGDPRLAQPPKLELLCASEVRLADISDVHALAPGRRVVMQIEPGGRIEGPRIKGRFLPGGVIVQLARADQVIEVEGRFLIETDDGHHIVGRSMGLMSFPPDMPERLARGEPFDPGSLYTCSAIAFEAAQDSRYAWLNHGLYIIRSRWTGDGAFSTMWRVL